MLLKVHGKPAEILSLSIEQNRNGHFINET
jgi:hypothetical protein